MIVIILLLLNAKIPHKPSFDMNNMSQLFHFFRLLEYGIRTEMSRQVIGRKMWPTLLEEDVLQNVQRGCANLWSN